ncbi:MAG TPA: TetR/AcrR family transcriptional regulator [Acidimicrobiales bacterium]
MPTSRRRRSAAAPPEATAPPAGGARRTRSRARKGEGPRLRDEILVATEKLLLRTGSAEAVSIRAVADAVGVTPPSIYRHFPDKTTLIFEVCARYFAQLDAEIDAAVEGLDDPMAALRARGRAYIEFGRQNPEPYRVMFMVRPDKGPAEAQDGWIRESRTFRDVVANVQACIDIGALRPEYDDALATTLGFWARVHGLTALMISKPSLPWSDDAFIEQYVDACLYGVGRVPPPSEPPSEPPARASRPPASDGGSATADQASSGSADQSRSGDR